MHENPISGVKNQPAFSCRSPKKIFPLDKSGGACYNTGNKTAYESAGALNAGMTGRGLRRNFRTL